MNITHTTIFGVENAGPGLGQTQQCNPGPGLGQTQQCNPGPGLGQTQKCNPGPGLGQTQKCGGVKKCIIVSRFCIFYIRYIEHDILHLTSYITNYKIYTLVQDIVGLNFHRSC